MLLTRVCKFVLFFLINVESRMSYSEEIQFVCLNFRGKQKVFECHSTFAPGEGCFREFSIDLCALFFARFVSWKAVFVKNVHRRG